MPVYIVTPLTATSDALNQAVESYIESPADRYKLQADRGWLIRFDGTSIELSDKLRITGKESEGISFPISAAIVVPISSYWGRGPTDMWEWLKTRIER